MNPVRQLRHVLQSSDDLLSPASLAWMGVSARLRPGRSISGRCPAFSPERIRFRPRTSDLATLREVVRAEEYAAAVERLPEVPRILDVGANIGLTSRYFLTKRPAARILAVEALRETFLLLKSNLAAAGSSHAHALHAAAWSHEDTLRLSRPETGAFSRNAVVEEGDEDVRAMSMNQLLDASGHERLDLCKIDIEGAEVAVLGADLAWAERTDLLAIEYHDDSRETSDADARLAGAGLAEVDSSGHTVLYARDRD